MNAITCKEGKKDPPYKFKKMSLVDFYMFEFSVSPEDFREIKVRLENSSLFFGPHKANNSGSKESAFFHFTGPVQMHFPNNFSAVMTFGSVELFFNDCRVEIHNNSLARAVNMLNVMRYIILGDCGNGNSKEKINVVDMTIEVSINASLKDKTRVKDEATKLAKMFEEFINGEVHVKIDKKLFDYHSCSYCGIKNSEEVKLKACSACKGRNKAIYCSKACQKRYHYHYYYHYSCHHYHCHYHYSHYHYYSHWKYHKEKAGH